LFKFIAFECAVGDKIYLVDAALRAKGHSHGRALRGVADRLLAVLIAMLRSGTLYDPNHQTAAMPLK
jgi:hypothetical protein